MDAINDHDDVQQLDALIRQAASATSAVWDTAHALRRISGADPQVRTRLLAETSSIASGLAVAMHVLHKLRRRKASGV